MNISIIGGGNIGTLMAAEFANRGHQVLIYTSKPDSFQHDITVYPASGDAFFTAHISKITDSIQETAEWADLLFITVPAHVFSDIAKKLYPYVNEHHRIGIVPGSGGAEFAFHDIIKKGCLFFGLQRVHSIARLKEYGSSVYELGRKSSLQAASIPANACPQICSLMESLFHMPCTALNNYLAVTLTPSNPILHTSRLYSMFKDYKYGDCYPHNPLFYEDWDDAASRTLIACDAELQTLCANIPLELSDVLSLKQHYESETAEAMTAKLRSIQAFKGILSPMTETEGGWQLDWNSRYFISDFPYGLKIIRDLARIFDTSTPEMDTLWMWFEQLFANEAICVFQTDMTKNEILNLYGYTAMPEDA